MKYFKTEKLIAIAIIEDETSDLIQDILECQYFNTDHFKEVLLNLVQDYCNDLNQKIDKI